MTLYCRHNNVSTPAMTKTDAMMTLQQCRKALLDRNIAKVARRIGMTRQQLWLIAVGINANPKHNTIKRISDYLESVERE